MLWALKNWRIIALVFAVLSLLGALWAYGVSKYREGYDQCVAEQEKADIEGIKTNDKIRNKVIRLSDPDLDTRISRWVR